MTTQMVFGAEPGYVGKHRPDTRVFVGARRGVSQEVQNLIEDLVDRDRPAVGRHFPIVDRLRDTVDRARDLGVAS